jgi:predicted Zn-dependent protease with MMP-like domain
MRDTDSPDEMTRLEKLEEIRFPARRIQSSRSFLLLAGSSLAIIALSIFLNLQLASSTKILILFALLALILCAIIYMDRNSSTRPTSDADEDNFVETTVKHVDDGNTEPNSTMQQIDTTHLEDDEQGEDEGYLPLALEQQALTPFEQLVRSALDSIPPEFHERMQNVIVQVEDEPGKETLDMVGTREGQTLLGLYHGVPITSLGYQPALLPQRITIYQHTIERHCGNDPERIQAQVRATVLHEVAHHFGICHEEMPIWIR